MGKWLAWGLSNVFLSFKSLITAHSFAGFLLGVFSWDHPWSSVWTQSHKISSGWVGGSFATISSTSNVCLTHWNCRLSNYFCNLSSLFSFFHWKHWTALIYCILPGDSLSYKIFVISLIYIYINTKWHICIYQHTFKYIFIHFICSILIYSLYNI